MSIVVISNYSKKQEYSDLSSLRDEIQIEARSVLDYSINNGDTDAAINSRLQDFTQEYIGLESRDKDLYFVFGTQDTITLQGYQRNAHDVSLNSVSVTTDEGAFFGSSSGGSAVLQIDDDLHVFPVNSGQNFYFVLSRDIEGGDYVVTG